MKQVSTLSAKRYGPRYGKSNRMKVGQLEAQYRNKAECPYCHAVAVKRLTRGIFGCSKCGAIFTGRAYTSQRTQVKR
ncbi:MAG: 50S ribosomal protein L37ae [Candidatus Woesearchaeota archaeon]